MRGDYSFVISCEHASAEIPGPWRPVLADYVTTREEHEIWDPGAKQMAQELGRLLPSSVFLGEASRLLVDLNRSLNHRAFFSPPMMDIPAAQRTEILCRYYYPYRHRVLREIEALLDEKRRVVHLSVHSFVPVIRGTTRKNDFGLLFDPWHKEENKIAEVWLHYLRQKDRALVCLPNHPYLGISDGHVPTLRKHLARCPYFGFELEFNQKLPLSEKAPRYARWIQETLMHTLESKAVAQAGF